MQLNPVAREARTMTRAEVIRKAIEKHITWQQAAEICGVAPRHMLRLRRRYELFEIEGLRDRRTGKRQPSRIPAKTVEKLCQLKKDFYADFSARHFHQFATECRQRAPRVPFAPVSPGTRSPPVGTETDLRAARRRVIGVGHLPRRWRRSGAEGFLPGQAGRGQGLFGL